MAKLPVRFLVLASLLLFIVGPTPSGAAALSPGTVRGTVTGPDAIPMGGVTLILKNDTTGFHADTRTDKNGRFLFFNVPFNPYELHVEVQGFQVQHIKVDVRTASAVEIPVALALETVSARGRV